MTPSLNMEHPRLASDWTVRTSRPGPDVAVKALILYPDEFKPVAARPAEPGLRIPRRGAFVIGAADAQAWAAVQDNIERGARLVLREPSGRNHEVDLGWAYQPPDSAERYSADGLAGLAVAEPGDLIVAWRASDLFTLT